MAISSGHARGPSQGAFSSVLGMRTDKAKGMIPYGIQGTRPRLSIQTPRRAIVKFRSARRILAAFACLSALAIAGCGGDDSSTTTAPPGSTPTTPEVKAVVITGVAASGAAFTGGVVSVIDSRGTTVGTSEPVGDDGRYTVTLAEGATPPLVLVATRATSSGEVQTLVSVVASTESTIANLTPITTLIASRLSSSGDPARLAEELAAGQVQVTPEEVAATVDEVKAILEPLLAASGTSDFDPLRESFSTDGTGHDRLLDSINVTILPSGAGANIEIAVKPTSDEQAPTAIVFDSAATVATILADNQITGSTIGGTTIDGATLAEAGLSVRIAELMQRMTACYAVPFEQRVAGAAPGIDAVVGTAVDVIAPDCRGMFFENDPALYKHNGAVVRRTASNQGAFNSLFRRSADGVAFSLGTYEFTRANGDYVVGYTVRDMAGGESFGAVVARTSSDGALRLIGNQYDYPGHIVAYHQKRSFITLGQEEFSYFSTGYTPQITNVVVNGVPIFDRVEVTTPRGSRLVLVPTAGQSQLVLLRNGVPTATNYIRLRVEYVDGSTTRPHPSVADSAPNIYAQPEWSEAELVASTSSGSWKFDYFLAGNSGASPDETQYYRTRARALSIGELRSKGFAELAPALTDEIRTGAPPAGQPFAGQLVFQENEQAVFATSGGGAGWGVLAGQMPPTSITLFGTYNGNRFNDSVNFSSTARSATVPCSPQSQGDQHCFLGGTGFAAGAAMNSFQLWSSDSTGREYAHLYGLYDLP